jgi:flagellar biosynthetic protein FliR
MDMLTELTAKIDIFLIVLARVSGIFVAAPLFSNRAVPRQVKIGLTFIIALIIYTARLPETGRLPSGLTAYTLLLAGELIIGLVIGFVAQLVFAAVMLAGQMIDFQMGFSIVNVIDPLNLTQVPLVGSFKNILALLVFLTTNGHHYLLDALYRSFDMIPLFGFQGRTTMVEAILDMFGTMFVTGIKIAIPVVGAIFVAEVAMGIIARTVPQMNVFIVGIPAKIFVGLAVMIMVIPLYTGFLTVLFERNFADIIRILKIMG